MKLFCVEKVLNTLESIPVEINLEKQLDNKIAKILINNLGINYLLCKEEQVTSLSLLNIDAVEVYPEIYKVVRVLDLKYSDIKNGDLVIKPQCFLPKEINENQFCQNVCLNIVRIGEGDVQMFKKYIRIILDNTENNDIKIFTKEKGITFFKIFRFEGNIYNRQGGMHDRNSLILDLRNNNGGRLTDMKNMFENIFESYHLMGRVYPMKGFINFTVRGEENSQCPKVIIIMNSQTASSAEIFIRLCKFYFHAVLIGTETFGKNVICKNVEMDGFSFSIPQYKYKIEGREIDDKAIVPDFWLQDIDSSGLRKILPQCDEIWGEGNIHAEI